MRDRIELLAPGSLVGHGLGIMGFLLMLFAWVGYSWRKQETRNGPGSMQQWLASHVATGLAGPAVVLLHTGFRYRGLAGVLSLMVLVVVLSGVAGRYWFTTLPLPGPRVADVRSRAAWWWLLHVPLAAAMIALALVHIVATLYYSLALR